jgi:hypothetical protein
MIRATELGLRMMEFNEDGKADLPPLQAAAFWDEMHKKTLCIAEGRTDGPRIAEKAEMRELLRIANLIAKHFHATIEQTGIDERHDSSFGLVLFAINLLIETAASYSLFTSVGRSVLRSIVECLITLSYLVSKDDPALWLRHRDYGNGQTKLSFLKNLAADRVPNFVDLDRLESLANEDKWLEFNDINLGAWAAQNLRSIATEANLKDVYDGYYDLCSGYTHGHWSAIRDSAFVTCFNPLHRFHKIPAPINFGMKSVLTDGAALINRMLDALSTIYPGMTDRITFGSRKLKRKVKATRNPTNPLRSDETSTA